jgi:hypothetical protein
MAKNHICCISLQIKAHWSDSFFPLGFRYMADTVSVSALPDPISKLGEDVSGL